MGRLVFALIAAVFAWSCATPHPEPTAITAAFVDVTVIAEYGEARLYHQTILIRGDRIDSIGPANRVRVPPGVQTLGRPGEILAPGLADMHVHIFNPDDGVLFLANGVTTVRNMSGRADTNALAARIVSGDAPGPHIYSSGPIINGPPITGGAVASTPSDIRALIATEATQGYIAAKLYETLSPEVFAAGVAAARAHHLQVYAHVPLSMTLEQVLALHIDSIEHLTGFDRALTSYQSEWDEERWAHADTERMSALATAVARSGEWNDATLVTWRDPPRAFADIAAAEAAPNYRYASAHQRTLWRSIYEEQRTARDPAIALAMTERGQPMRLAMLRALREAHAPLLIGTDAPQPFVYAGFSLQQELAMHQDAGFSRAEILRIASHDAARFLHQEREFGAIVPGTRADLLLLDRDPESDLAALRDPAGVMAAGRWYDAPTLHRMLDEVAARNAPASHH